MKTTVKVVFCIVLFLVSSVYLIQPSLPEDPEMAKVSYTETVDIFMAPHTTVLPEFIASRKVEEYEMLNYVAIDHSNSKNYLIACSTCGGWGGSHGVKFDYYSVPKERFLPTIHAVATMGPPIGRELMGGSFSATNFDLNAEDQSIDFEMSYSAGIRTMAFIFLHAFALALCILIIKLVFKIPFESLRELIIHKTG